MQVKGLAQRATKLNARISQQEAERESKSINLKNLDFSGHLDSVTKKYQTVYNTKITRAHTQWELI